MVVVEHKSLSLRVVDIRPPEGWEVDSWVPVWLKDYKNIQIFVPQDPHTVPGSRALTQLEAWRNVFDTDPVAHVGVWVQGHMVDGVVCKSDLVRSKETLEEKIKTLREEYGVKQEKWISYKIKSAEMAYLLLTGKPFAGHAHVFHAP